MRARASVLCKWALVVAASVAPVFYMAWLERCFKGQLLKVSPSGETASLEIKQGDNAYRIGLALYQRHQTSVHPFYWWLRAHFNGTYRSIKVGEYETRGRTAQSLWSDVTEGRVWYHRCTLVEGQTFFQILEELEQEQRVQFDLEKPFDTIEARYEGRLWPETYFYTKGTRASDLLHRAHVQFESYLESLWAEAMQHHRHPEGEGAHLLSRWVLENLKRPLDAVILASIIQRESRKESEYALISAVYHRRLHLGMHLQADPTVLFGLGPHFKGILGRRHLRMPSPYNTYLNIGLPPGPIGLVGKMALRAALYPANSQALYFVADEKEGHHFSETYQEHLRWVQKYRLRRGNHSK